MNRQQFRAAYREARKAIRFYGVIKEAKNVTVASMFDTLDLCPRFDICRLHPDRLHTHARHLGMVTHRARMHELRLRPRLPA